MLSQILRAQRKDALDNVKSAFSWPVSMQANAYWITHRLKEEQYIQARDTTPSVRQCNSDGSDEAHECVEGEEESGVKPLQDNDANKAGLSPCTRRNMSEPQCIDKTSGCAPANCERCLTQGKHLTSPRL